MSFHRRRRSVERWRARFPVAKKSVSTAGDRLEQIPVFSQSLSNGRYVDLECILLYDDPRPYAAHQIPLRHGVSTGHYEDLEDVECAASDRNGCAESPEFPFCEIHLPAAEFEKAPFDLSQSDP